MSGNQVLQNNYTSRINRVLDYIELHLDKTITLEELAAVSHFSKFHFTRIFWAMIGETPFEFMARIRLEAWGWLFGTWFPQSGYQPDDKLPFELYHGQPKDGKLTVDICVPVKPL